MAGIRLAHRADEGVVAAADSAAAAGDGEPVEGISANLSRGADDDGGRGGECHGSEGLEEQFGFHRLGFLLLTDGDAPKTRCAKGDGLVDGQLFLVYCAT